MEFDKIEAVRSEVSLHLLFGVMQDKSSRPAKWVNTTQTTPSCSMLSPATGVLEEQYIKQF